MYLFGLGSFVGAVRSECPPQLRDGRGHFGDHGSRFLCLLSFGERGSLARHSITGIT